jgi:hypothetical protein
MALIAQNLERLLRKRERANLASGRPAAAGTEEIFAAAAEEEARQQRSDEIFGRSMGLARRGLKLGKKRLKIAKKESRMATGIGIANLFLTGAGGLRQLKDAKQERMMMDRYRLIVSNWIKEMSTRG